MSGLVDCSCLSHTLTAHTKPIQTPKQASSLHMFTAGEVLAKNIIPGMLKKKKMSFGGEGRESEGRRGCGGGEGLPNVTPSLSE